ncbi:MAG TPA: hypothetical protein VLY87_04060 [Flavobacterium sp.]|nr:hypothetical protein [Flavobacterium sp.]
MAIIKIQRSSEYTSKMRAIKIFIDGKQIGTIADGEIKEFTITEGQHNIEAKIDWCSSPKVLFNINNPEAKAFEIGSFAQKNRLSFFFPFYYLTIGRKKYLTLNEINYGI